MQRYFYSKMYLSPRQVQSLYGYHPKTLAQWADDGKIEFIRTPGKQRRYLKASLDEMHGLKGLQTQKVVVLYARVSTSQQKPELASQIEFLQERHPQAELVKEVGSGMNFKRKKFLKLLSRVMTGEVGEIVVAHKDRLARFGFDLIEWLCNEHDCTVTVLKETAHSPEQEMVQDFVSIIHCFTSRLYFLRKYEKKIKDEIESGKAEPNVV